MSERMARIALADDDVLLREGVASLLERYGYDIVGQAGDAPELLALVREHGPELVIVDIRMPPAHSTEGLDAARVIRQEFPAAGILVLSAHVEVDEAMELLAGGQGIGYLLKSRVTDVAEFVGTIERIVRGGSVVDPGLVQELVAARRRNDPLEALTPREHDVLALDGRGVLELGHRPPALGDRGHRREAREQHPHEAAAPRDPRRPSARPGGHRLPGSPLAGSTSDIATPRLRSRVRCVARIGLNL